MKKFFRIETSYKFEMGDLRALLQLINVVLIIFMGFNIGAVFGLVVALLGIINDFLTTRRINGIVMHLLSVILNVFILFFL